jgi:hypothetical protein
MNKSGLIDQIQDYVLTGGRQTKAINVRELLTNVVNSYPNIEDGGQIFQEEVGYDDEMVLSSDTSFVYKKWVEENFIASGGSLTSGYLPYWDGSTFQNSYLQRDSNGIVLDVNKTIRSNVSNKSQISFGVSGDEFIISNDGGTLGDAYMILNTPNIQIANDFGEFASSSSGAYVQNVAQISLIAPQIGIGTTSIMSGTKAHIYRDVNDFLYELAVENPNSGSSAAASVLIRSDVGKMEFGQLSSTHSTYTGYGSAGDTFIRSGTGSSNMNFLIAPGNSPGIFKWFGRTSPVSDPPAMAIDGYKVGIGKLGTVDGLDIDGTLLVNEIDVIGTGGTDVLNIGATSANVINYGNASTIHNFLGTAIYELQVNAYVEDKLMTLNYGGAVASGIGVGYEIEENSVITGYTKTNSGRSGWSFKAPANTDYTDLIFSASVPRAFTFPDISGTIATINGGQTFSSGTWQGTPVAIAYGGTNSNAALVNNRIMVSEGGAIVEGDVITPARALISDANGIPTHSAVTAAELLYLSGVTSNVQTQLNKRISFFHCDASTLNPTALLSYYLPSSNNRVPSTASVIRFVCPFASNRFEISVRADVTGTLGTAGQFVTVTLHNYTQGTSQVISTALTHSALNNQVCVVSTLAFAANDLYNIQISQPNWTLAPTGVFYSADYVIHEL